MNIMWGVILTLLARSFALPLGLGFADVWVRIHTLALGKSARDEKRADAQAFYRDLVAGLKEEGYAPPDIGPHVFLCVIRGIPADVAGVLASLWTRLSRMSRRWLGAAQFWLAILAVLALWWLRRLPRLRSMSEPNTVWPIDWAVLILCLVMLVLYSGALERAPALAAKWGDSSEELRMSASNLDPKLPEERRHS